jgi:two-component system, OmpR family, sensor histidine kinase CreC
LKRRNGIFLAILGAYVAGVTLLLWRLVGDVDPRYREATEESLVETANLLAALIEEQYLAEGGTLELLPPAFRSMYERKLNAEIYGVRKTRIEMRIRVVDATGRVTFDSLQRDVGADYSRWRDVRLALAGEYGARTTPDIEGEPSSSVMYVAAPIAIGEQILGAVSVGKPESSFGQFANAARRKTVITGLVAAGATLVFGLMLSLWFVVPQGLLTDYLRQMRMQRRLRLPALLRHSAETAGTALRDVRDAFAGNSYAADYVQTLTHELKGPLSTIRGAAELLGGPMSDADRERFLGHVLRETERIQQLVDRMMELAALESRRLLAAPEPVAIAPLLQEIAAGAEAAAAARGISIHCTAAGHAYVLGDALLLRQAIGNLLDNALDFSPDDAVVELQLRIESDDAQIAVLDQGPGLPHYARDQVFQKFFSLQRPVSGRRSTGLGLSFVREIAHLHHGQAVLRNRPEGGAEAILTIPLLPYGR